MKLLQLIACIAINIAIIWSLNVSWGNLPRLGFFFSPQHGYIQNANPKNASSTRIQEISSFYKIKKKIDIVVDSQRIPHVFAHTWQDALFAEGYLHAKERLFEMDALSRIAEGKLSELLGDECIPIDKYHRSLGISVDAENTELYLLQDKTMASYMLSYAAGVNFYIARLKESQYPVEYKLLNAKIESWSVYKCLLLFKYLSLKTAASSAFDIDYTRLKRALTEKEFETFYPVYHHFFEPIISESERRFEAISPLVPADAYQDYFNFSDTPMGNALPIKRTPLALFIRGNDNEKPGAIWAVSAQKSTSGYPMLCSDFRLQLPALSSWYEIQLNIGEDRVYGFSYPGFPFIWIGFNDSLSWGFNDAKRDVLDYYTVNWTDSLKNAYTFDGRVYSVGERIEEYTLKSGAIIYDTLKTTVVGPILFNSGTNGEDLTFQWTGQTPSKEALFFYKLNAGKNKTDVEQAADALYSPALNIAFATHTDIGIMQKGLFPVKWYRQGDFIMPLRSPYVWSRFIADSLAPRSINPAKDFVGAASQHPTDEDGYPYYIGARFFALSGLQNHTALAQAKKSTVKEMMDLQTNSHNYLAQLAIQNLLGAYVNIGALSPYQANYYQLLMHWNFNDYPLSLESALFKLWWKELSVLIWKDRIPQGVVYPQSETLLELLIDNYNFDAADSGKDAGYQKIYDIVQRSFAASSQKALKLSAKNLTWWKHQNRYIYPSRQLSQEASILENRLRALASDESSDDRGDIKMIVSMTPAIEAYISYSSQSGKPRNPESKRRNNAYRKVIFAQKKQEIKNVLYRISITSADN